jgi:uncharacterized membrane protein YqaE (UPF0057 family)
LRPIGPETRPIRLEKQKSDALAPLFFCRCPPSRQVRKADTAAIRGLRNGWYRLGIPSFHGAVMRLLLAIFLPFTVFFTIGRPIAGVVCLILQLTLIGWIPAALWAVYALSQYKTDKRIEEALGKR